MKRLMLFIMIISLGICQGGNIMAYQYNPVNGYLDANTYPNPATEEEHRTQANDLPMQALDFINDLDSKKENSTDITNNRKLSPTGNFTGTWHGLMPTQAEPGLTATVNAHLADYVTDANGAHGLQVEYGIFTPVIAGSNVAGNNIYEWRSGEYYKIGRLVRFKLGFKLSAKDDAMNGHIQIGGLPFVCSQGSGISADIVTIHQARLSNIGIGLSGYIQINTSAIYLYFLVDNGSAVQVLPTNINNTTEIRVSGTYLTN